MRSDTWRGLSLYESHDFVHDAFSKLHKRSLNAQRIREITANFAQAREYFHNAADADTSVRPLLSFYGVSSLAKGLILFKNPMMKEESLKPGHGLSASGWATTLSSGIGNILGVSIEACGGIFPTFVEAEGNTHETGWFTDPPQLAPGIYSIRYPRPVFIDGSYKITLGELFSREPRLTNLMREMGLPVRVLLSEVVTARQKVVTNTIASDASTVSEIFGVPISSVSPQPLFRGAGAGALRVELVGSSLEAIQSGLPVTEYQSGSHFLSVVDNFGRQDRFAPIVRTYVISYALGMLVRYFPSKWMALVRNEKGDRAQPLILAAMDFVQTDFPALTLASLKRN